MLEQTVLQVTAMVGFAALITLLINVAKFIGWVKEGQAANVAAGVNLLLILVVYGFKLFKPEFDFLQLDPVMQEAALVGNLVLTYILQLFSGQITHAVVRGLPVVGKSFSLEQEENLERILDY